LRELKQKELGEPLIFHAGGSAAIMRVIILSSGGKDSCYALWWAYLKGWDIAGIVTVQIRGNDSLMFQLPATLVSGLQAASAEIPWTTITVSGTPEIEMQELQDSLQPLIDGQNVVSSEWSEEEWGAFWPDEWPRPNLTRFSSNGKIDAIITGALRSDYQKTRIERMAEKLGVKSFTPLWHHDPYRHMSDLVEHDFELLFTSVSADGLDEQWIGRTLDSDSLAKLNDLAKKHRFSIDGEGGEFETTVVNAPWMNRRISIHGDTIWSGQHGFYQINTAKLVE
jgi:diphthamide synthase (EF-2-diphthine--ammonia ligase)